MGPGLFFGYDDGRNARQVALPKMLKLFGTIGFDGMSSLLYHTHRPTMVKDIRSVKDISPKIAIDKNLKSFSFKGFSRYFIRFG